MQIFLLLALLFSALPAFADDCGFDAYAKDDYAAALKPLTECVKQGNAFAQYNLGLMYAHGLGVPKDDVKAYKWWNLAAAEGDAGAKKNQAIVERKMTPAQIAEAQKLSSEWKPTK